MTYSCLAMLAVVGTALATPTTTPRSGATHRPLDRGCSLVVIDDALVPTLVQTTDRRAEAPSCSG